MRQSEPFASDTGGWEVDLALRQPHPYGLAVPIGTRPFGIIETLARASDERVTKDDLIRCVWLGAVIDDNPNRVAGRGYA